MKRKLAIGLITGAILGVFCIIGATTRSAEPLTNAYLFAFWFNRLLMGFVIALLPSSCPFPKRLVRGMVVGLFVSFAFYSATEFYDLLGFLVGAIYGLIIEFVLYKLENKKEKGDLK
jgi:uncharacterized membrane protein